MLVTGAEIWAPKKWTIQPNLSAFFATDFLADRDDASYRSEVASLSLTLKARASPLPAGEEEQPLGDSFLPPVPNPGLFKSVSWTSGAVFPANFKGFLFVCF